jgi:hypothetical protein
MFYSAPQCLEIWRTRILSVDWFSPLTAVIDLGPCGEGADKAKIALAGIVGGAAELRATWGKDAIAAIDLAKQST